MNESRSTRALLLESALSLFARCGYDGTSVKAITARAGANQGAVTYHFGGKENLYHEVLRRAGEPLLREVRKAAVSPGDSGERIERVVRAVFAYLAQNQELPALMMHELTLERPIPRPIRHVVGGVFETLVSLVKAGQRAGTIVFGDPVLIVVSIAAQPLYAHWARRPLRAALGRDLHDEKTRARLVEHVVAFIRRGLTPTGRAKR